MKHQLLYLHGGDSFKNKSIFLDHLRTVTLREPVVSLPGARQRWTDTLPGDLSPNIDVYMPTMPNKQNADFLEWKIWFEKYLALVGDGVVFVGWSMGAWFLAKYMAENQLSCLPKAIFLVAGPAHTIDEGIDNPEWNFDINRFAASVREQGIKTFIFHSEDDPVVPFSHAEEYAKALPEATFVRFSDRGHFLISEFPELVEAIKGVF